MSLVPSGVAPVLFHLNSAIASTIGSRSEANQILVENSSPKPAPKPAPNPEPNPEPNPRPKGATVATAKPDTNTKGPTTPKNTETEVITTRNGNTNTNTRTNTDTDTNISFATAGTESVFGSRRTSSDSAQTNTPTVTPNFPPTVTPSSVSFLSPTSSRGNGNRNKTSGANRLVPGVSTKGWKSKVAMGAILALTISLHSF